MISVREFSKVRVVLAFLGTAVLTLVAYFAIVGITPAPAEGPNAVQGLVGCSDDSLYANDDSSTGLVDIGFGIEMQGSEYDQLYVNNNGNVSFDRPLSNYTPFDFTATGEPIIAPFLADVDTRGDGSPLVTYGQTQVGGRDAFCVNWVNVGHYSQKRSKLNSFQLLIVDQPGLDFDIVFNYDKVQWETGDASGGSDGLGGTSAAVGFAEGDGNPEYFYVHSGSYENGALLDSNQAKGLVNHTLNSGGQLGRYTFQIRHSAPTGASLSGEVTRTYMQDGDYGEYGEYDDDPVEVTDPVPGAPVEICRQGGSCTTRLTNASGIYRVTNLAAGSYSVVAHDPSGERQSGRVEGVAISGVGTSFTQDVELGDPVEGPPPGTTVTNHGLMNGEVPTVYMGEALQLRTEACDGGTATYSIRQGATVVASGPMAPGNNPGVYRATVPGITSTSGFAVVSITVDCPGAVADYALDFSIYIDPSGVVKDQNGNLVTGAEVSLYRSSDADGPFVFVPQGSALMSPSNRDNPSYTDSNGRFGWDVVAGYYKVIATKEGCTSVESRVMEIPPPVTDLDLRIDCSTTPDPDPDPDPVTPIVISTPDPVPTVKAPKLRALAKLLGKSPVKAGKTAKVKVSVFNDGMLDASGVKVCGTLTRSASRSLKKPACKTVGTVKAGAFSSVVVKIKTVKSKNRKKSKKTRKVPVRFAVSSSNAAPASVGIKVKVK